MNVYRRMIFSSAFLVLGSSLLAQQLKPSHQPTVHVAPRPVSAGTANKVVARVNGVPITAAAYDQEVKRVFPYYSLHGDSVPAEYQSQIRQQALDHLIDAELAFQEAKRLELQIKPAEWQARLAEIRKDYKSKAEFDAATQQMFGSRQAFEAALRHDMLLDKIWQIEVTRRAAVTAVEVRREYDQHRAAYVVPEMIQFQTISTIFPRNAGAADKQSAWKRMQAIVDRAKAAKTEQEFGLLAEKSSEDEYRVMMGMHKPAHVGSMDPAFEKYILTLKEGEVGGPVESSAGYHLVRLVKHQRARALSFVEVKAQIRKSLEQDKLKARTKAFQASLRKSAKIEIM